MDDISREIMEAVNAVSRTIAGAVNARLTSADFDTMAVAVAARSIWPSATDVVEYLRAPMASSESMSRSCEIEMPRREADVVMATGQTPGYWRAKREEAQRAVLARLGFDRLGCPVKNGGAS